MSLPRGVRRRAGWSVAVGALALGLVCVARAALPEWMQHVVGASTGAGVVSAASEAGCGRVGRVDREDSQ
jgi:hypothetical protein